MKNFNLPYVGSKGKIADKILLKLKELKPKAKVFIDLFGGSGSLSFNAMRKEFGFEKIIYNEYDQLTYSLFDFTVKCLQNQKYKKYKYGIFPDSFYELLDKEQYENIKTNFMPLCTQEKAYKRFILLIHSFGNSCLGYGFTQRYNFKKQLHNFVMYDNEYPEINLHNFFLLLFKYYNVELTKQWEEFLNKIYNMDIWWKETNWKQRRIITQNIVLKIECLLFLTKNNAYQDIQYIVEKYSPLDLFKLNSIALEKKAKQINTKEKILDTSMLENLLRIEAYENLQLLELNKRKDLIIETYNNSYNDLNIQNILNQYNDEEVIIVCDAPYKNTVNYYGQNNFNFDCYYNWLAKQEKTIHMCEYDMPFKEIYSISKTCVLTGGDLTNINKTQEKIYVNKIDN